MSKLARETKKGSSSPIVDVREKPLAERPITNAINGIRMKHESAMNVAIAAPDPATHLSHEVEASASLAH